MLFLESQARTVLLLHTIAAGVLVGAATHQLLASRRYLRGQFERSGLERRYARITAVAFAVTFVLGASLYPVYKVRVRAEYLDAPQSVAAERALRIDQAARAGTPPPAEPSGELSSVARLFDVKEHWVAIGLGAAVLLALLSRRAHPSETPSSTVLYLGLSIVVCLTAWIGAVVGVVVASYRSVGGST